MRVMLNLAYIAPGRVGGSEEYAVRLVRAVVERQPDDIELRIFASRPFFGTYPDLKALGDAKLSGAASRPLRILSESTALSRGSVDVDVVHHFGGRLPALRAARPAHVVTVHDLQPVHQPANFSWVKRRYLNWALPRSVTKAEIVATPSEWVGESIVDAYGVSPTRVRAVSSTWDDDDRVDPALAERFADRRVILYPAVTHPHKAHDVLIRAVDELARHRSDVVLALPGGEGSAEAAVRRTIESVGASVERLGRVTAPELRGLLASAGVLAFPSDYEGFGLPVLEAMRAGIPVVAGGAVAVAEVLGGTGRVVAHPDPSAWAAALDDALNAPAGDVEAARNRAEHYAPANAAERLISVWRDAAAHASTTD